MIASVLVRALIWLLVLSIGCDAARQDGNSVPKNTLDENGTISLLVFVPFSHSGVGDNWNSLWVGVSQMAGALMAIDHFNNRDAVLVPELAQLQSCNLTFGNRREIYDTGTVDHIAAMSLLESVEERGIPTALAGTYNEIPASEISVMATSMGIPMVSNRGTNFRLVLPSINPFFTQVNADPSYDMEMIASYLDYTKRTDFIAIIYSTNDANTQRVEALRVLLEGKRIHTEAYFSDGDYVLPDGFANQTMYSALQQVKLTGFRTIIVLTPHYIQDFPILAAAADDLKLNNGDYFWIHGGVIDISQVGFLTNAAADTTLLKFLQGSAVLLQIDQWAPHVNPDFYSVWLQQNASHVQRLNEWSTPREEWNVSAPDNYFETAYPEVGTAFLYDAVMTIGLGACRALENATAPYLTGSLHHENIQQLDFSGASGRVYFDGPQAPTPSSRVGNTVIYGMLNLYPPGRDNEDEFYVLADVSGGEYDTWTRHVPFIYADGSTAPPELLRDTPQQNYLNPGVRAFGLALMSLIWFGALVSGIWIFWHRNHHIVRAGQPAFLYMVLFGASVMAASIFPASFDESFGWSKPMLDMGCVAGPWLAATGYILVYSALFTKLWRINKVLQFRRRRILIRHVAWPMVTLFLSAIGFLSAWTATTDFEWIRKEIDEFTGESIGGCSEEESGIGGIFMVLVGLLIFIPTIMTLFMAYKTKDIDSTYAESSWIFILVLIQFQVILVGAPVVAILQDVTSTGRYFGETLLTATMSLSAILLMVVPRMVAYRRVSRESSGTPRASSSSQSHARGSHNRVSVTGIAKEEDPEEKRKDTALRMTLERDGTVGEDSNGNNRQPPTDVLTTLEECNESNASVTDLGAT